MASNDEKLSKFNQAINHYAQEQRTKIEQEVADFKKHELEDAEVEVLTESYRLIQKEMVEMRNGIIREMAHREMNARRELLTKRQKITDEVFGRASDTLLEFTKKEDYAAMLEKSARRLSQVFQKQGGNLSDSVLCLKPDDNKYEKLVLTAFGSSCTVKFDPEIEIGGIRAYHVVLGILADETLDTILEDQREWFEENCGMAVV